MSLAIYLLIIALIGLSSVHSVAQNLNPINNETNKPIIFRVSVNNNYLRIFEVEVRSKLSGEKVEVTIYSISGQVYHQEEHICSDKEHDHEIPIQLPENKTLVIFSARSSSMGTIIKKVML